MKTVLPLALVLLTVASTAGAANIPSGLTGLWRFRDSANKLEATVGSDLVNSTPANAGFLVGPWTKMGVSWHAELYSDGGMIMDRSFDYVTVNPGFNTNGGGSYVNEYTIMWDVNPDPGLNSLYQTAYNGNADDGDLWIIATNRPASIIGVAGVGFSSSTFDGTRWHRIVLSVKNGDFFRVYVDGTNYLNGAGQAVDGRFSMYPDRFHLFADNDWQDAWIRCGTVATWNRALTSEEIAGMGGWIDASATPTELSFIETPGPLLSVSPTDGQTNVSPEIAYSARILDPARVIGVNNVQLLLDGVAVPVAYSEAMLVAKLSGGLFGGGTTHTYTLIGTNYFTNTVTVTVQNYTSYEWRFTNGDLSISLGDGVMSYWGDAQSQTSFGTTDGSTVPHINGTPAKYMHVPGFTLDTDGYQLLFNDSGPNVGTNAYINRYTLLIDMLVPSPWSTANDYMIPFFNTDPNNLSDADFYLRTNGALGIGTYSGTKAVSPDTWSRIAFVADLEKNTLWAYTNGTPVHSRAADGLEGRWALYSNQDISALYPANLLLFNEGDTSGIYTHDIYVSSIAFVDRVLSAGELASLGGPSAAGILVPSVVTRPTLGIQQSAGGATISWPPSYVGYRLEQTDSLAAPQWKPVGGIVNNSVLIPTGSAAKYFRLVQ